LLHQSQQSVTASTLKMPAYVGFLNLLVFSCFQE